jgi:hypothetical protein
MICLLAHCLPNPAPEKQSYRPTRLHRLAESIPWNRFLGSLKFKNTRHSFCHNSAQLFHDVNNTSPPPTTPSQSHAPYYYTTVPGSGRGARRGLRSLPLGHPSCRNLRPRRWLVFGKLTTNYHLFGSTVISLWKLEDFLRAREGVKCFSIQYTTI